MLVKKASQGSYYYTDPEIEKFRYNPYRKHNREIAEIFYKNGQPTPFPLHVIIETSSRCQLDCIMCTRKKMTRPQNNLDLKLYKKIIDEATQGRVYSASLYSLGEPLLHPQISDMIIYAKRMGVPYVDVSTNGMLPFTKLLNTGLNEIIVSIDGDINTYSQIRPGGDYLTVLKNLCDFINERKGLSPFIRLQIIDFEPPKYDIEELIKDWLEHEPVVDVVYRKKLEGMSHELDILPQQAQLVRNKDRKACKQLFFTLTVNAQGDISYCCHDPQGKSIIGNIKDMTLKEAWERIQPIRDEQLSGLYNEFCNKCVDSNNW